MTIQEAVSIFNKKYPNQKVIGYWIKPEAIILNVKIHKSFIDTPMPGQYIVNKNGQITPTNPVLSDISIETMRKIGG